LADGVASDADYALFGQVVVAYQAVLNEVERRLRELGFEATIRVKTIGTLTDKLRRDPTLKLRSIHDVAGARIVIDGRLDDQDDAKSRVIDAFASCPREPVIKDRRRSPSYGYRAVHVIVFPENLPVEIQIRTKHQDQWAQVVESLGDRWGRGLRYGAGPDDPDALAGEPFAEGLTRAQVVETWLGISDTMYETQLLAVEIAGLHQRIHEDPGSAKDLMAVVDNRLKETDAALTRYMGMLGVSIVSEA
jgi:ppGpp synthetase/RelA/SpoT-type nucleotidyltranferase